MTPTELMVLRKQYKLSQAQLGAKLGVTRLTVSNWERARFAMPVDLAQRMAALDLMPPAAKADKASASLLKSTVDAYREMRADTQTHAEIMLMWQRAGFMPSREAQLVIAAAFPDILNGVAK